MPKLCFKQNLRNRRESARLPSDTLVGSQNYKILLRQALRPSDPRLFLGHTCSRLCPSGTWGASATVPLSETHCKPVFPLQPTRVCLGPGWPVPGSGSEEHSRKYLERLQILHILSLSKQNFNPSCTLTHLKSLSLLENHQSIPLRPPSALRVGVG